MTGTVLFGSNNVFTVESGGEFRKCSLKGKKLALDRRFYNPLAPGDEVELMGEQITALVPRRNAFSRWNEKGRALQILAANVDTAVVVTTPAMPPFRPRFVDRVLVHAAWCKIDCLIVVNKADLGVGDETVSRIRGWENAGYRVLWVSAATGEGIRGLRETLTGKLSVFLGQSGVGKSSLVNALAKLSDDTASIQQRVGEICAKYERGTHTTSQGVLLRLMGRSEEEAVKWKKLEDAPVVALDSEADRGKYELNRESAENFLEKAAEEAVFHNPHIPVPITLNGSELKNLTAAATDDRVHLKSLAHIGALLENAVPLVTENSEKTGALSCRHHYLLSAFTMEDTEYTARILLEEQEGAVHVQQILTQQIKKSELLAGIRRVQSNSPRPPSSPAKPVQDDANLLEQCRSLFAQISGNLSVIDTPGVRRFQVYGIEDREAAQYFPEIAPLALQCRFGPSCTHTVEAGCKVRSGVEDGTVHPDRYESLLRIKE